MNTFTKPLLRCITLNQPHQAIRKKLLRRFSQIRPNRRPTCRRLWSHDFVDRLRELPTPHSPQAASRFLYSLWMSLQATEEETSLLNSVYWLRGGTCGTGEPVISGGRHQSPSIPTHQVLAVLPTSTLQLCPQLYILIDLEGARQDWVEASVLICDKVNIIKSLHMHARPVDEALHQTSAKYCHGIKLSALKACTNLSSSQLQEAIHNFAREFPTAIVLSADESINSDVREFMTGWGQPYKNIPLTKWVDRIHHTSHKLAVDAKRAQVVIVGSSCPYRRLHHPHIRGKGGKTPNASQLAKVSSGSHCSLYDCYELFLYLKDSDVWPKMPAFDQL